MATAQSKQARTYRLYEQLWLLIALKDPEAEAVGVFCHPRAAGRIIQAVRKEKAIANKMRKALGLARYGEMDSTITAQPDGRVRVTFQLKYNGDLL